MNSCRATVLYIFDMFMHIVWCVYICVTVHYPEQFYPSSFPTLAVFFLFFFSKALVWKYNTYTPKSEHTVDLLVRGILGIAPVLYALFVWFS